MTPEQLAELKDNVDLRNRLAKKIAHDCFRDTKTLENMHAANLITDDESAPVLPSILGTSASENPAKKHEVELPSTEFH
jgi:hypothetical protein